MAGQMWPWRTLHTVWSGLKSPIDPILTLKVWSTGRVTLSLGLPGGVLGFAKPSCLPSAGSVTQTGLADTQALPGRGVGQSERNSF